MNTTQQHPDADGKNLVIENRYTMAVSVEPILVATERNGVIRIVTSPHHTAYSIDGNKLLWLGYLRGTDKAMAAVPGSEFRGWKNTKQRRLTEEEISNLIKNRVFVYGGYE